MLKHDKGVNLFSLY